MGGNAFPLLKNKIVRLEAKEYYGFQYEVLRKLRMLRGSKGKMIYSEIISYEQKSSFGDLDIIYAPLLDTYCYPDANDIAIALNAVDIFRNGPVTSFAVPLDDDRIFQVDLIKVSMEEYDFAYNYFAYNDLGNLLGRIFHRAGFKFGHKGLSYIIRDEENASQVIKEVILTRSWTKALEFAGYDHLRWMNGFKTLEEVFEYAVSIPLASRAIFRLEETNHQARVRDRKRKTYQQFLHWINDPKNNIPDEDVIPKDVLRSQALLNSFNKFPKFKEEYYEAQKMMERKRKSREKFNGTIVSEITGLTGKELGRFIHHFKIIFVESFCFTSFEDWTLSRCQIEIELAIRYFFNEIDKYI